MSFSLAVLLFLSDPALEKCIGDNWKKFNTEIVQYFLKKDRFRDGVINLVLASYDNSVYNAAISKFCTKNLINQLRLNPKNIRNQIKEYLAISNQASTAQDDNESEATELDSLKKSDSAENENDSEPEIVEQQTIEENTQDQVTQDQKTQDFDISQTNISQTNNTIELLSEQIINARPNSNSNSRQSNSRILDSTFGDQLEKLTQKVDSLNLRILQLSQQSNNPSNSRNPNSYQTNQDEKVLLHQSSINEISKSVEKATYQGIQQNFQQMTRDLSYTLTNPHSQVVTDLSKTIQLQVAGGLNKTQSYFGQEWAKKMDASIHKFLQFHHQQFFEQFDREMTTRCQNINSTMNEL